MSWWWLLFLPLIVSVLVSIAREYYGYLRCSKYRTQGFLERFRFFFGVGELYVSDKSTKTNPFSRFKKILGSIGDAPGLVVNQGPKAIVFLKDQSLIHEFYLKESQVCRRHEFSDQKSFYQEYFPFSIGKEADEQRARFKSVFHRDNLDAMIPSLLRDIRNHIDRVQSAAKSRGEWTDGTFTADWKQPNVDFLYHVSNTVLFGQSDEPVRVPAEGNGIFGQVLMEYLDGPYVQTLNSSLNKFFCRLPQKLKLMGSARRADVMRSNLLAVVNHLVKERAANPAYKPRHCIFDLRAAEVSPEPAAVFSTDTFLKEAAMYMISGINTVKRCLNGALYNLALYPDIAAKLYGELQSNNLASGPLNSITLEKVDSLQYLEAFLKESLRTLPVFLASFTRLLLQDFSLGKYKFYRGDLIEVPYISNFFREDYFPNTNKFDPERFAKGLDKSVPPAAFTPFGAGSRSCIGRGFAEVIVKLFVIEVLRRFEVSLPPNQPEALWVREHGEHARADYKVVCTPRKN